MKKLILLFVCLCYTTSVFAVQLSINIPDAKLPKVIEWMKNTQMEEWAEIEEANPTFTDAQIARKVFVNNLKNSIYNYECKKAGNAAEAGVIKDDDIVQ